MPSTTQHIPWFAPIAQWAVWDADVRGASAPSAVELEFVEPLLRRRLSSLAKMTLKVAHDCVQDQSEVRFVYASRHGDLTRTTAMLNDLAQEQAPSPSAFSMSVLNAGPGLFSILRRDTSPVTAISAETESLGSGLLEACIQLAENPQQPVLFVYAEESVPCVYGPVQPPNEAKAYAIGVLLYSTASMHMAFARTPSGDAASHEPQAQAFLRCLQGARASVWHGGGKTWNWQWQ